MSVNGMQDFNSIVVRLASPDQIRAWSYGEVKKPETINYRTLRPEKEGLFCERIFGTTKEWECYCGKFKSIRYKGVVCDRCGVEVAHPKIRRERMGHIELASPVSHIWYYRSVPSRMGLLLDLTMSELRSILYYEKYIVTNEGDTDLRKMDLLTEEEYLDARDRYGRSFSAGIGAEAVRTLLEEMDLEALSVELREIMIAKGGKVDKRILKRIRIINDFKKSGNKPSWMIMDVVPVIPPELRPMIQLDGGRFATSDLNDLYRRVINRNNRLNRLLGLNAPDIIIRNEKRMLQEAVDALFDNSKKKRMVKGASNRPLKSLSDMLRGKQGRFRQNLLGKRVDYSGRSVIVVGPELKLHQCGLPTKMALELFKPFIMKKLVEQDIVFNIKRAKTLVEQEAPEVFHVLDEIVREHPVLLNRAPTLHRLGIQAFEPVLVDGKAIKLHPMVCHAYNADFDGDQMAVHVPLTQAAQVEAWTLMLSSRNLLNPANGQPIVFPGQDIVLGINYLTSMRKNVVGENKYFSSFEEVLMALEVNSVEHGALIKMQINGEKIETTPGRILFNAELPDNVGFINETLGDKELRALISKVYCTYGPSVTVTMLDVIKSLGFRYATMFGATIGIDDILVPENKKTMIAAAGDEVAVIQEQYLTGVITQEERYNKVVEVWSKTNEDLTNEMMQKLEKDRDGFNPVYMMANSGARGSRSQIRQLAGMRGLMAKPSGDIIELPIRSNFKEGLSVIEFFISTNGARKGLADTALKTADAGYLTRRLVDIAQDAVVTIEDCGTINGIEMTALKDGEEVVETLADRIRGCFTIERVKHPITGEIILNVNEEISAEKADEMESAGVESVRIRTVLTCETEYGVCQKCYGHNLASGKVVNIGEAVGIIAAQSIGQPGTQLTMRTFHIGGVATRASEENRFYLKYPAVIKKIEGNVIKIADGTMLFTRKGWIYTARIIASYQIKAGDEILLQHNEKVVQGAPVIRRGTEEILAEDNAYVFLKAKKLYLLAQDQRMEIRNGAELHMGKGKIVEANETIASFDPFSDPIICEYDGTVRFQDIIEGTTLKKELNEETGNTENKIVETPVESMQPSLVIEDANKKEIFVYPLPNSAYLSVLDGEEVKKGQILAKMLKESIKTRDITGGLPRVEELFEARRPKNAAVLAQIGGVVKMGSVAKGKRILIIEDKYKKEYQHAIPMGTHIFVRNGDTVEAGDPLSDGNIDPHDVLNILGENALRAFLVNEVQEVYRLQGVNINDKHIGVIIRHMIRKVEIVYVGDTNTILGEHIDRHKFYEENARVVSQGGQPAVARPLLLSITRASLNIDSFISAASFMETTRVLTNAAIAESTDNLRGLKENVVIGNLIPAGTGMRDYHSIRLYDEKTEDIDAHVAQILEERRQQKEELAEQEAASFAQSEWTHQHK